MSIGAIQGCTSESFHPYECSGAPCRHCERRDDETHDPGVCALCDPEYDYQPNPYWNRKRDVAVVSDAMTDADVLRQVREVVAWAVGQYSGAQDALAALDGCRILTPEEQATGVWLTAEEAERVRGLLESGQQTEREEYSTGAAYNAAISAEYEPILALFTPEER